jgi:hypothetical protein
MRSYNEPVINAGDASGNLTSIIVKTENLHLGGLHVTSTGTAAGSVSVEISNDEPTTGLNPSNWVAVSGLTVSVSGANNYIIPKFEICYNYLRVKYTASTGTGTLTAKLHLIGY